MQTRFVVGGSWLHELLRALFVSWRLSECVCVRARAFSCCLCSGLAWEMVLKVFARSVPGGLDKLLTGTEVLAVSFLFSADTPY